MYPFLRLLKEFIVVSRKPKLGPFDVHKSYHMCWPWDLDMFAELNNGRTLTLYDLGRIPLANRAGLVPVLVKNKWRFTMAGVSVRYRRRVTAFQRIEMHSRLVGWDHRFFYMEQTMWVKGQATSSCLYRTAIISDEGIVEPPLVAEAMQLNPQSPQLPDWVSAWIEADAKRQWPPETAKFLDH